MSELNHKVGDIVQLNLNNEGMNLDEVIARLQRIRNAMGKGDTKVVFFDEENNSNLITFISLSSKDKDFYIDLMYAKVNS